MFKHTGTGSLLIEGVTISGGTASGTTQNPNAAGGCITSEGSVMLGNPLFATATEYGAVVTGCRAVALANGTASGGGVFASKEIIMTHSKVTHCEVEAHSDGIGLHIDGGGGIMAAGRATLFATELSDNLEDGSKYGGGGAAFAGMTTTGTNLVLNSTISGNTARYAGGLSIAAPTEVRNSTISGNVAMLGGGILVEGTSVEATLDNLTITDNTATSDQTGGGLLIYGVAPVTLRSSIVAGNFRAHTVDDDIGSSQSMSIGGSNNLVGLSTTVYLPADTVLGTNPQLQPLAWNGGATRTHALQPTSQAIGRGINARNESWDQRGPGFPRLVNQRVDIGAFEYSDVIFADGFD